MESHRKSFYRHHGHRRGDAKHLIPHIGSWNLTYLLTLSICPLPLSWNYCHSFGVWAFEPSITIVKSVTLVVRIRVSELPHVLHISKLLSYHAYRQVHPFITKMNRAYFKYVD